MTPLRGILAAHAFACVSFALPAAAQDRGTPGKFDFYVLALSWAPSYCEAEGDKRKGDEQCTHGRPYAFVVHGLWPQYERGFPRSCIEPAPFVPNSIIGAVLDLMPARGLIIHQWRTHGTCSGLDARRYFDAVRTARERIEIPDRFRRLESYTMVSPSEVEQAFLAANPKLPPEAVSVTCDDRRLREVRICLSTDLSFRPCAEIERRACRTPRVVMPPVRGG
jgi:ribonuclease T2